MTSDDQETRNANRDKSPPPEYVWLCFPPAGIWNSGPTVIPENSYSSIQERIGHYQKANYTCHRYKTTGEKVDDYNPIVKAQVPLMEGEIAILKAWGYNNFLNDTMLEKQYSPDWIRKNILKSELPE